jgi:hypothetical protein
MLRFTACTSSRVSTWYIAAKLASSITCARAKQGLRARSVLLAQGPAQPSASLRPFEVASCHFKLSDSSLARLLKDRVRNRLSRATRRAASHACASWSRLLSGG